MNREVIENIFEACGFRFKSIVKKLKVESPIKMSVYFRAHQLRMYLDKKYITDEVKKLIVKEQEIFASSDNEPFETSIWIEQKDLNTFLNLIKR